jgi:large subunit ribosomal protein L13
MNKTYSLKKAEISRSWYLLDASETPFGRLSTHAASLLIGKGKPTLTHHMDNGDFVVIVNAENMVITGNKEDKKIYWRHSGYPGGIYKKTLREAMEKPEEVLRHSIRGMLPVNKLREDRLKRLKIYRDDKHNHEAQQPKKIDLKRTAK